MRRVGKAKKLSQSTIDSLGGTVRTFGSFALGVYGPCMSLRAPFESPLMRCIASDIDTLIVAPRQILYDDFFKHFPQIFREMSDASEITELNPVPDAFVPIIKMEYRGVSIDLIFASLPTQSSISQDIDLTDVNMLRGMDQTMMRSLNGTRVTKELLDSVPQVKSFRYALRAIKLWSNQRGIYGAVFGYPGGIAWAIMVARICQLFPYACGATIVSKFFNLMRQWHWPRPVMLKDIDQHSPLNLPVWNPQHSHLDRAHLMPIITPAYPQMCSTHSVMQSTKAVMLTEFERANEIIGSITAGKRPWDDLFKRHTFFTDDHKYYLSVVATGNSKEAHEAFKGLVQSKVRILAKGIEESGAVDCARPYMKGFERIHRCNEDQLDRVKQGVVDFQISEEEVPSDGAQPSNGDKIVYTATFYIGLKLPMEGKMLSWNLRAHVAKSLHRGFQGVSRHLHTSFGLSIHCHTQSRL